ncbi:MAG: L,D-transpeptidase [Allosphingosinicella sp.]|uniref:L,D-transpeptidase n=1 Tax=Allosphingosinicella sp. TaxID=2823234 RepID=UPI00394E8AFB
MRFLNLFLLAFALLFTAACGQQQQQPSAEPPPEPQAQAPQPDPRMMERQRAQQEAGELRFVVDKSDRKVRVYRGDEVIRTHDVAVGDSEHETPSGSWQFDRVDINPEWIPPDSEWAEDRERRGPGDPQNPMGRARLVFNMPYTIHGTDNLESLGQAASHGSIRVANSIVIELAELLLRAGGAWDGQDWFRNMLDSRNEEFQIRLERPIPIEVVD